ncbi:MAG: 50S ribosomal protein L11 methyltransferase [Lachnospiraceae bacterium]|nr:50S ribosomal protein L11 methyltransferase [Lachnospiraceae bacterium]
MIWQKIDIETTSEAEDIIVAELEDMGVEGIEISDNVPISEEDRQKMFIDILPELPKDDNTAHVTFYADSEKPVAETVQKVKEMLSRISQFVDAGKCEVTVGETKDADWINNWKEFFKPFRVDENIVIKPSWEELTEERPGDIVIEIDPGTAFGTGSHETTRLCIQNIRKYLNTGATVLDVGTGSGILSVIAKKLGAGVVTGVDIDPNAVKTAEENTELNGIKSDSDVTSPGFFENAWKKSENRIDYLTGNILGSAQFRDKLGKYDLVVANILADVIIPLSEVVRDCMNKDGVFISSGIINTKEDEVRAALEKNGFRIACIARMGDWVSIVAM